MQLVTMMSSLGVSLYSWHVDCNSLSYNQAKQVCLHVRMNSYGTFDSIVPRPHTKHINFNLSRCK